MVSITGCRDAAAWEDLAERVRGGDLAAWSAKVDAMRHSSEAKVIQPVPWSPLQEIDLATRAGERRDAQELALHGGHGLALRRRAAGLPPKAGTLYDRTLSSQKEEGTGMIELEAAFQPVYGTHMTTEVILWQRVVNTKAVMWMLGHDLPPEASAPGTWLHDALEVRDRWESRLLRSAAWSPLY